MKILYVEDSDLIRDMVAELIESPSREVHACDSAEAALALMQAGHHDLLVTDVNLPGMSGVDLTRHVQAHHPEMPVILCTGHDLGGHARLLGERVHHLLKPFEPDDLLALIERVIPPCNA